MWKATTGFVIGVLLATLVSGPIYAGKKNKPRVIEDTDRDGVIEFMLPLYREVGWSHECCGCALVHRIYMGVVDGPIGLPWLYMRWEVDERATNMARIKKFGPGYWRPQTVDPLRMNGSDPW